MTSEAERLCEEVDAALFSGDTFNEDVESFIEYLDRWKREAVSLQKVEGEPTLPSQLSLVTAILMCFGNRSAETRHINAIIKAADSILAEFNRERRDAKAGMGLAQWLASDDTGISSKYMAGVLSGEFSSECAPPWDPADFGRCYRMLRACPELVQHMAKLNSSPDPWPALRSAWEELEKLYVEGLADRLYDRLQELTKCARYKRL